MFNKSKQAGFTLLELLVVITLLALLSVGALVAYDGVGDNASSTAASNNIQTVDRTIRQYQAVTGNFPNQWDILASADSAAVPFDGITGNPLSDTDLEEEDLILPQAAREAFGGWTVADTNATAVRVMQVLADFGIDELQVVDPTDPGQLLDGVVPNTAHNEGANAESREVEADGLGDPVDGFTALSILPTGGNCTAGTTSIAQNFNATLDTTNVGFVEQRNRINSINDFLEDHQCNLILAMGFGGDAAKSMQNSSVQMTSAPTFASRNVNPARQYARFVGLFHMGSGQESVETALPADADIGADEIFSKPRLIAILTPEGRTLDEVLAEATASVE